MASVIYQSAVCSLVYMCSMFGVTVLPSRGVRIPSYLKWLDPPPAIGMPMIDASDNILSEDEFKSWINEIENHLGKIHKFAKLRRDRYVARFESITFGRYGNNVHRMINTLHDIVQLTSEFETEIAKLKSMVWNIKHMSGKRDFRKSDFDLINDEYVKIDLIEYEIDKVITAFNYMHQMLRSGESEYSNKQQQGASVVSQGTK